MFLFLQGAIDEGLDTANINMDILMEWVAQAERALGTGQPLKEQSQALKQQQQEHKVCYCLTCNLS